MSDDCACFQAVMTQARSNALNQAYGILVDCAALGDDDDRPPRSVLMHGIIALAKIAIDDHYSEAEGKKLIAILAQLSSTATHFAIMEHADEQHQGH